MVGGFTAHFSSFGNGLYHRSENAGGIARKVSREELEQIADRARALGFEVSVSA